MALIFHERVGLNGRRISPFSWRIGYVFAHKGGGLGDRFALYPTKEELA